MAEYTPDFPDLVGRHFWPVGRQHDLGARGMPEHLVTAACVFAEPESEQYRAEFSDTEIAVGCSVQQSLKRAIGPSHSATQ